MDASLWLICLTLGQLSPPPPSTFPAPPSTVPGQFVPQPPPTVNAPTAGEPTPVQPTPGQPTPVEPEKAGAAATQPTLAHPSPDGPSQVEPASLDPLFSTFPPFGKPEVIATFPRDGHGSPSGAARPSAAAPIATVPGQTPGGVVQTMAQQPVQDKAANEDQTNATAVSLLAYALAEHADQVEGQPVSLRTVIDRPADRSATVRAIKAYWQLALAIADHHHAVDEAAFLSGLPAPSGAQERAVLESEVAAARARQAEAELALVAAQQDLSDAAPPAAGDSSPLTSDLPFVGAYRTNFAAIFHGRTVPPGVKRIDRTLPVFERLIGARATAVSKGAKAMLAMTEAYHRGEAPFSQVMEVFLHLRQQRIAFLAAVRDYNYSIADYAMSVASPELGRDAIVSMLIETPRKKTSERSVLAPSRGLEEVSPRSPTGRPSSRPSSATLPAGRTLGGTMTPVQPTSPNSIESSGEAPNFSPPAPKAEPAATAPQLPSRRFSPATVPGTFVPGSSRQP